MAKAAAWGTGGGQQPEPEIFNVYGAQESIPVNQFRQTR